MMNETAENLLSKQVKKKFLKILLVEGESKKININLPIGLAEVGLKLIPKDMMNSMLDPTGPGVNFAEIIRKIKSGIEGDLFNFEKLKNDKMIKIHFSVE